MSDVSMVLFDLGGVLVELDDIAVMWADKGAEYRDEELWKFWLLNEDVQAIDRGQMEVDDFLTRWKATWKIELELEALRDIYRDLVKGALPGAQDLLKECHGKISLCCLSNLTVTHWPRVEALGFSRYFDQSFISCEMGAVKPEAKAYTTVLEQVSYEPMNILFLDDNIVNVEAARQVGMRSQVVKGPEEARAYLKSIDLI